MVGLWMANKTYLETTHHTNPRIWGTVLIFFDSFRLWMTQCYLMSEALDGAIGLPFSR